MKHTTGLMTCGCLMIDWQTVIFKYLISEIISNNFKTATIIAPGGKFSDEVLQLERYITIENVYDKDPNLNTLNYNIADPIFDDIEINSDIIITFHGEKLYPPTRLFNGYHFLVVKIKDRFEPTTLESLSEEQTFLNMSNYGPFLVFTGNINV